MPSRFLMLTLTATLLGAQGAAPDERPRATPERTLRPRFQARIQARLHRIRQEKIQESLGVPEGKAKAIADRWGQFDEDSLERRQGMRGARQQMQDLLMGPGSEEDKNGRVGPLMERYNRLHLQQQEARRRFEDDIRAMLTPVQQGRFIILMNDFQNKLREALPPNRAN